MSYGLHWYITKLCVAKQHWLEREVQAVTKPASKPPKCATNYRNRPYVQTHTSTCRQLSLLDIPQMLLRQALTGISGPSTNYEKLQKFATHTY